MTKTTAQSFFMLLRAANAELCLFSPDLYKEYRSLKQAKENSSSTSSTDGKNEQSQSTSEANPSQTVPEMVCLTMWIKCDTMFA